VRVLANLRVCAWLSVGLLTFALAPAVNSQASISASTWPTLHRDNQRSGYTSEVVEGPYERKWFRDFHDELIATRVEAIVAEGKVFVGTLAGNLYALRVDNGATAWKVQTAGPIGASGCYAEGKLYQGGDDGLLRCLSATEGKELWRYTAQAGIWVAPANHSRSLYFGDRAGVFHAIDLQTGRVLWKVQTGGMILTPASVSADGQQIVFASEDMHVYCVDPHGRLLWKSAKLGGLSLRDHAPTIWQGLVIVRSNPAAGYHQAAGESPAVLTAAQKALPLESGDKVLFDQWGVYTMKLTPRRLQAEREAVLKFLEANPAEKTFYAFELTDGREPWTAPVLYTCGMHNTATPPTFDPCSGELFLWVPTTFSTYAAGVPGGAVALGRLDRKTGLVEIMPHSNADTFNSHAGFCPPADETFALSLMGNTLLNTHQGVIGRMDRQTRKCGVLAGRRDSYGGIFGPTYVPDPWKGGQERAHLQGQLVFLPNEWHGPDRAIVAIAEGRLFWIAGSQVVCIGGPDTPRAASGGDKYPGPIQRRTPLHTPGGNLSCTSFGFFDSNVPRPAITNAPLRKYLQPPSHRSVMGSTYEKAQARLNDAVRELVEGGPWAPLIVELGPSGEERHFWRTSETIQTLAAALPFLSSNIAAQAVAHLDDWFAKGAPLKLSLHEGANGKRRELYDPGPQMLAFAALAPRYQASVEDFYAVWSYAHYADRWPRVLEQKHAIKQLFTDFAARPVAFDHEDKLGDAAEHLNRQIAGTLAYARIMDRAGEPAEVERALVRLTELVIERVHHELADSDLVRSSRRARYQLHQAQIPRYNGLVPELGGMLREFAGTALSRNLRQLTTTLPVWYQAFGERMIGGETYISTPNLAHGLFTALGYGIEAAPAELNSKLDQPWCKADLYYIEKLVAILRAPL
jgi:outer membrane protein assembly factor BamB